MSLAVTLLGTGSPLPDPNRAGPSTLVSAGDEHHLVDAGRGVLMRMAAAGVGTLILTHYVPPFPPGGGAEWHDMAAAHFDGVIEVGDDLHRVEVPSETDNGD